MKICTCVKTPVLMSVWEERKLNNIKWVIGICDDEEYYRNEILEMCQEYGENQEIDLEFEMFEDGRDVLESDKKLDILFLDIAMKNLGGMDIVQELRAGDNIWRIIFATSHDEESLNGYGSKTIGFLTKPLSKDKVYGCLDMAKREYLKAEVICFRMEGNERLEHIENIVYIEGEKNYVRVFTVNDDFLTYGTIKYWESQLKCYNIVRIHKSYLVNLKYVMQINEGSNIINIRNTETELPIGRTYRTEIKSLISRYRINRARERLN